MTLSRVAAIAFATVCLTIATVGVGVWQFSETSSEETSSATSAAVERLYGGDLSGAVPILQAQAQKGDPVALYHIAWIIGLRAEGIVTDGGPHGDRHITTALLESAGGGNPLAPALLAQFYLEGGGGLDQSLDDAVYWCGQGIERGDPLAAFLLGHIYLSSDDPFHLDPELGAALIAAALRTEAGRYLAPEMAHIDASAFDASGVQRIGDLANDYYQSYFEKRPEVAAQLVRVLEWGMAVREPAP